MTYPHIRKAVQQRAVELEQEKEGNKVKYILLSCNIQDNNYFKELTIAKNNGTKTYQSWVEPIASEKDIDKI